MHGAWSQVDELTDEFTRSGGPKSQGGEHLAGAKALGDDLDLFAKSAKVKLSVGSNDLANHLWDVFSSNSVGVEVPESFSVSDRVKVGVGLSEGRSTHAAKEDVVSFVEELLGDGVRGRVFSVEPIRAVLSRGRDHQDSVLGPLAVN